MADQQTSINKTLDILCLFDEINNGLSAREISHSLTIPLSSTYKYLDVLLKRQFLRKDPHTKKYQLGPMVDKLGSNFIPETGFIDVAVRHMQSLTHRSDETVFLSVIKGREALIIERIEPSKRVKLSIERGATIPLYAGAAQKVLLAYQKDQFIDNLIKTTNLQKMTANTIVDPDILKEELKRIKKQGFASSDSEVHSWTIAVAAPIFNLHRMVVAGLGIAIPKEPDGNKNLRELTDMVRETALNITNELRRGEEN